MEGWDYWLEKKVWIVLKNGREYTGYVIGLDKERSPLVFMTIIDKYNARVTFSVEEIELIKEDQVQGKLEK